MFLTSFVETTNSSNCRRFLISSLRTSNSLCYFEDLSAFRHIHLFAIIYLLLNSIRLFCKSSFGSVLTGTYFDCALIFFLMVVLPNAANFICPTSFQKLPRNGSYHYPSFKQIGEYNVCSHLRPQLSTPHILNESLIYMAIGHTVHLQDTQTNNWFVLCGRHGL